MTDMQIFHEVSKSLAFACAFYVAGAALCRLRKTPLKPSWSALYAALLGNALWFAHDMIDGATSDKDIAVSVVVALYIFLTRASWAAGMPEVAKRRATK